MPFNENNPQQLAEYEAVVDRFSSYEERCNARLANNALIEQAFYAQQGQTFNAPILNDAALILPHATVLSYVVEQNSGPKEGFRPAYFFDLNTASTPTVTVTVSGDITLPEPGTFSYPAFDINPLLPMAVFLVEVVEGLGVQNDVYFGVERDGTCLSIVGKEGYTLENVSISIG
jgi:hypothetical protein